jgi:hypothetical protein
MVEAGDKAGMSFAIGDKIKGWMEEVGFVNVHEVRMPWPVGGWTKDKFVKHMFLYLINSLTVHRSKAYSRLRQVESATARYWHCRF